MQERSASGQEVAKLRSQGLGDPGEATDGEIPRTGLHGAVALRVEPGGPGDLLDPLAAPLPLGPQSLAERAKIGIRLVASRFADPQGVVARRRGEGRRLLGEA